jgi:hypothetical protein
MPHTRFFRHGWPREIRESGVTTYAPGFPRCKRAMLEGMQTHAVEEFRTYITNNSHLIPNYGERYRNGEGITTNFIESMVNQPEFGISPRS